MKYLNSTSRLHNMKIFSNTFCRTVRNGKFVALLFVVMFLHGCGGRPVSPIVYQPPSPNYPEPALPEVERQQPTIPKDRYAGPAAPLYRKAKTFMAQEDYRQAELAMERALRIEPKNGYYWYTLAEIKFADKQYGKMKQLCLKSKSLAGADKNLIQLNDRLINKAH
jgi:tetratricopeptide (TPR) repeat protein